VFLNGCSTQQQTQGLLDANVSAVISTSRVIDDRVATDFSCRFYQGLAGGASVRTAYHEAEAAVRTAKGGNPRALYFGDPRRSEEPAGGGPLALEPAPARRLRICGPMEPTRGGTDPLFGLPPLPEQDRAGAAGAGRTARRLEGTIGSGAKRVIMDGPPSQLTVFQADLDQLWRNYTAAGRLPTEKE
jgi:hypothetical protein